MLQGELAAPDDFLGYRAFLTAIVDEPAIEPNGWFEVAFDGSGQRACVAYADRIRCERGGSKVATTAPRWFSAQDPLDASEAMFRHCWTNEPAGCIPSRLAVNRRSANLI